MMGRPSSVSSKQNVYDLQIRAVYRRVTKNGCMGIDQAAFVAAHFGIDSSTMRKCFRAETSSISLTEDQFVEITAKALKQCTLADQSADLNKNQAVLHKSFSLPQISISKAASAGNIKSMKIDLDSLKPLKARSEENRSRMSTGGCPSAIPEGGPVRPRSASYMELFTPRGQHFKRLYGPKRWALVDSNVPKNVRAALLNPATCLPSPLNTARSGEDICASTLSPLALRMMEGMKTYKRVDLLQAIESAEIEQSPREHPPRLATSAPLCVVERGFQIIGAPINGGDLRELARELRCLGEDDRVEYHKLIQTLIPPSQVLRAEEAGIAPSKYAKFKRLRLRFTETLSTTEIRLLSILRSKLEECCRSAKMLRDVFRRFDPSGSGRLRLAGLVASLAVLGITVPPADAEVLASILDPRGRDGIDYNELTSLLMPPDRHDVEGSTVAMGADPRMSRSRRGLTMQIERERRPSKPGPAETMRFVRRLTTPQILQACRPHAEARLRVTPSDSNRTR